MLKIFKYLWTEGSSRSLAALVFTSVAATASPSASFYLLGLITDEYFTNRFSDRFVTFFVIFISVELVALVFEVWRNAESAYLAGSLAFNLRRRAASSVLGMSPSAVRKRQHGWLVEMLITKSSMFEDTLRNSLSEILYSPILLLSTFIIMVFMNWKAALALLLPVPLLYITIWLFVARLKKRFDDADRDRASLTSSVSQTETGLVSLLISENPETHESALKRRALAFFSSLNTLNRASAKYQGILGAVAFGGIAIIAVGISFFPEILNLTPGTLVAFAGYAGYLYNPFLIATRIGKAYATMKSIGEEALEFEECRMKDGVKIERINEISVENMSFSYEQKSIYDKFSLKLVPGTVYGISGPSGCGKTTLVRLLLGLLQPTSGKISVNGTDFSGLSLRDYWRRIGVVLQDDFLFGSTVREAVTGGWETSQSISLAELPLTDQPPEQLSAGEKQRACLIRALVKNPDLIIIDEGTSQLDLEAEKRILQRLTEIYRDRIIIIVSHRPTALAFCGNVVRLS